MRIVMAAIGAIGAVFVGLLAVGVLGVASAETTSSSSNPPPVRTVSVDGIASAPVSSTATTTTATGVYREAMAAAIADGKEKAQFLAEKAGASLGAVQDITEGGGYVTCPEEEEYTGGEPDFGSGGGGYVSTPLIASRAAPGAVDKKASKHRKKHKKRSAKAASIEPCSISTDVSLVYELS
jgi:Protein of unknown function (DUF541)